MASLTRTAPLSLHGQRVLELLQLSDKPLTAYDILEKLRHTGIKAPPTVYRALEQLMRNGLAHRIESLNAFVACHSGHAHGQPCATSSFFTICSECGRTEEVEHENLRQLLGSMAEAIGFAHTRSQLELHGNCAQCRLASPPLKASA